MNDAFTVSFQLPDEMLETFRCAITADGMRCLRSAGQHDIHLDPEFGMWILHPATLEELYNSDGQHPYTGYRLLVAEYNRTKNQKEQRDERMAAQLDRIDSFIDEISQPAREAIGMMRNNPLMKLRKAMGHGGR